MRLRSRLRKFALALLLALALPAWAGSIELEGAKAKGLVGEKADGFVGIVVADPTEETRALVEAVNRKRLQGYQGIAANNKTSVDAVAAVAGQKLVERTPAGQWVTDAQGNWYQK